MATPKPQQPLVPRPIQATTPPPRTTPAPARKSAAQPKKDFISLFDRDNYIIMAVGILIIFAGFQLMSGGKSPDPHKFLYDEIYSFRRITLAPIMVILGFVVEVFAIMKKPKDTAIDAQTPPATL